MTELSSAALRRLDAHAVIAVTGPDARSFLQGQLSFDLDRLTRERMELACCNSAQGRVQAVLWLIERTEAILLLTSTSIADATLTRLRKYVLRAKVKLETRTDLAFFDAPRVSIEGEHRHVEIGERSYIRWPGERVACIAPAASAPADALAAAAWHRADIAAGLPRIYPQTHETFVAQMLNLDALGAIGFEKGCYTGQEIIARTHYRGAIKRRMFRFQSAGSPPAPGTRIVSAEQHAGDVVDAVSTHSGCELLAVVGLSHAGGELQVANADGPRLAKLDLPYSLDPPQA